MPQRSALRADKTMPRTMRAARFFWKMPRYTTSQIRADMGRLRQQWSTGRTTQYPDELKWSRNKAYGLSLECAAWETPNLVVTPVRTAGWSSASHRRPQGSLTASATMRQKYWWTDKSSVSSG